MLSFFTTESFVLRGPYPERLTDDEFLLFCEQNRSLRIERTANREVIIMAPVGGNGSRRSARLTTLLGQWRKQQPEAGEVFGAKTGFTLPSGAMRSPDASWVSAGKGQALTEKEKDSFAPLCPEFVVELKSITDSLKTLLEKMDEYRDNGALLGWLLVPETTTSYVFRQGETGYETVVSFDRELSGEGVLPGFRLDLRGLK